MEPFETELGEEQLGLVNGGAISAEDAAIYKQIANDASRHHGVSVLAATARPMFVAVVDLGALHAGQVVHKDMNKKN
jgi:hypothetical protein